MNCSLCGETNPEANRYCGQCGAALDVASHKLRQQIVSIIDQEFKDQELVATTVGEKVAAKAEERLWRWVKVLGLAMTVFLAGLGFFGFTSFNEARSRIDDTSKLAITSLNNASQKSISDLNTIAKQNEQIITLTGSQTKSQMQQQVGSVFSKAKASRAELDRANQEAAGLVGQIETLKQVRDQHPDTRIGDITGNLFALTGSGTNLTAQQLAGNGLTSPYKEGATGPGVTEIQTRLAELGCYQGTPSGTLDPDTTKALSNFVFANGPRQGGAFYYTGEPLTPEEPSPFLADSTPGTVDYVLWRILFSTTAKKCQ